MKKVTAVVAGAGLRGMEAYAVYALEHPEELEIVAVAEPNPARREKFAASARRGWASRSSQVVNTRSGGR